MRRKIILTFAVIVSTSISLGCSAQSEVSPGDKGMLIGAGSGALLGTVVAGPVGAAVGGAGGIIAGKAIGTRAGEDKQASN